MAALTTSARAADAGDDPYVMGAIGDSISAGFDSMRVGDNREVSWSTGDSDLVDSHAKRVAAKVGRSVVTYNEAITGARAEDLDPQVTRLLAHSPSYVTLDVGANDVCSWDADYQGALAAFEQALRAELTRIIKALPQVKILLVPVPDVHNLYEVASGHAGCQYKWDVLGICKPLLGASQTDTDRAAFVVRWEAINATIAKVALDYAANVIHDPTIAHTQFTWDDVSSIDCFHPSPTGQSLLADEAWQILENEAF